MGGGGGVDLKAWPIQCCWVLLKVASQVLNCGLSGLTSQGAYEGASR